MIAVDERMRRKSAEEYLASTAESERFLDYLTERNEQEAKTWIVKKWKKVCDFLRGVFKKYTGKELSSKDEMVLDALYRSAHLLGSDTYARFNYYRNLVREMGADGVAGEEMFKRSNNDAIFTAAKNKFGITYDMREAGYILPDGSMLDFSGRHELRGSDTSFLNGRRTVDHRQIQDIAYDFDDNETGIETNIGDFLDKGAIRIDYNTGAINLNVSPTNAQKEKLRRLIEHNGGDVSVDFGKGFNTEHYVNYESAKSSRVLGDIDRYFSEGIKPISDIMFRKGEQIKDMFDKAIAGNLTGKPISIGRLTAEGKTYLENISGLQLKDDIDFVLNPSDLVHIYKNHYGENEKDKGNNIPLTRYDIGRMIDVISFPTKILYGEDKEGRKSFYFLMEDFGGAYNLLEIYANKKGNLSSKTYYKTRKGVSQRVMNIENSLHSTSKTDEATLSDAKIPQMFDSPKTNEQIGAIMYRRGKPAEYVNLSNLFKPKGTLTSSALAKEQALVGAYMQWMKGLLGAGRLVTNNLQSASVYAQAVKNYSSMKKSSLLRS